MTVAEVTNIAKRLVGKYTVEHSGENFNTDFSTCVVWSSYILGNVKLLLTTTLYDGMYYEVTYNKIRNEIYFDAYKKFEKRIYTPEEQDVTLE